jgi:hypothetical protein
MILYAWRHLRGRKRGYDLKKGVIARRLVYIDGDISIPSTR